MKLIVDSSILIDKLRGGIRWNELLTGLEGDVDFYLPSVVVFELFSGRSSKKPDIVKKISNLRKYFHEIDLTSNIAKKAGEINRDITADIDVPDYIIAATAMEVGAQIVTLNIKHFQKIPGLSIYPI